MTDQYTETNTPFITTAAKHGLIIGVLTIIVSLVLQLSGLGSNIMLMMVVGIGIMILYVLAGVRAVKEHRDVDLGGQITFGRAFLTALVATLIACLVGTIFSVVYTTYIDPSAAEQAMDSARDLMESVGADEDAIEEAMNNAEAQFSNPLKMFIQNFATAGFIGAIGSLIVAAVLKKDPTSV